MYAGSTFAGFPFAGILSAIRQPRRRGGIGGSGMSDAEYRRLLKRLGAIVSEDMTEDEVLHAAVALTELGVL